MKILLLFLLLPMCAVAQQTTTGPLVCEQPEKSFGRLSVYDIATKKLYIEIPYTLKNTGDKPIFITNCQTNDGGSMFCRWPKDPVLPNDSTIATICYDNKRVGQCNKIGVVTYMDDTIKRRVDLRLKGEIYYDTTQGPQMRFLNYSVDTLTESMLKGQWYYTFTFKNTGKFPFKLSGNCRNYGCDDAILYLPTDTVYPGETGAFKLLPAKNATKVIADVGMEMPFYRGTYTNYSYIVLKENTIPSFFYHNYPR